MEYRSFHNRIALDTSDLGLPMTKGQIERVLAKRGFLKVEIDFSWMIERARETVEKSVYGKVSPYDAPTTVDCATLLIWLYGLRGIALPRHPIAQRKLGRPVELSQVQIGDLVFTKGYRPLYDTDPQDSVGHCGVVTDKGTIINAADRKRGVVEEDLATFIGSEYRGAVRLIEEDQDVLTFQIPARTWVVSSSELKYYILKVPPHKH